jgi:hypothetical protein
MPFYEVKKTMQYTETVYVEADSAKEANDKSGEMDGDYNNDDTWHDSSATEIEADEFESNS